MSQREELLLERLQRATLALRDTLDERDALLREKFEPIAIVGVGCRFPGGADDPELFWKLLDEGRDGIGPLAPRWALSGTVPGPTAPRWAGLLTGAVEDFDPAFFGISPREAGSLDPQHRLLLEVGWEALEDAGIAAHGLRGSRTGVFVGATNTDYFGLVSRAPRAQQDAYTITGNLLSVAAGRLSYTWGLQGPCMTVDTVCSSSLVTVHLACQSLRAGESDLALAGGVNLILSADTMDGAERTQALAPDGRCKTFDALANGFARGEGCGLVVLKRLRDARRDGDPIRALIRGSAVNQDGASTGLTAPNVRAQQALLRDALASARVAAADVGFIETHGTGTALGDPIEVEALRAVLGAPRADGSRCVLGAVKTNLGHLEAAAGVAGLIKAVLALQHQRIPRNLNFRVQNPRIELEGSALALATAALAWPRGERPRLAGVSAFGLSGTNAHVLLEEAPAISETSAPTRAAELLVLSAKTSAALDVVAARLRDMLAGDVASDASRASGDASRDGASLGDLAFSLARTRSPLEHRAAIVAGSRAELVAALTGLAAGASPPGTTRAAVRPGRGALAFLFTGQGAQVVGMGRELAAAWPVFRAALERCAALFDRELERPLLAVMWAEPGSEAAALLDRTAYTQPALFALQHALVALWRSWGVEPALAAGHSVGELSAACAAGVFSLEDGARLVAARGRLMQALPAGGAMMSIAASEAEVEAAIAGHADVVAIAAINGPEQVVIAGDEAPVREIAAGFAAMGRRTRALAVSHAFHSQRVEPMLAAFGRVAATVAMREPARPLVSNVSGALAGPELATPDYWVRHARAAVRFGDGVRALSGAGARCFLEIGPRPALLASVPACVPDASPTLIASLRGGRAETVAILEALGGVWLAGGEVDWRGVFFEKAHRRVALPRYPWQRQRCWLEVAAAPGATAGTVGAYYDAVARADALADGDSEIDGGERYLTFAPFAEPVPGFSWLLATLDPTGHPEQARRVLAAQREMRAVLFRRVDVAACKDVLDLGCGYATDLLVLARKHAHLQLHGHTVSAEQASIGAARARRSGLEDRVGVLHRDSTRGPYLADYDLVFGVEVACHVRDKAALFANVGAHLREGGWLVLSDFVANTASDIEHDEAGSYLATARRWAEVLAHNHLRLDECVDVSPEIANFLDDPEFARNRERLRGAGGDAAVDAGFTSYDQLSRLLRRRMASYVLMNARRVAAGTASDALLADNLRALARPTPYAELRPQARRPDDRFLKVAWEAAPVPAARTNAGRWLLLGAEAGVGAALRDALTTAGHAVVLAPTSVSRDATRTTLARAFEGLAPTAVVHLGSLDGDAPADAGDGAALEAALVRGADSALALVQALPAMRWRDAPRLWLVTRAGQAAGAGDEVAPTQAPLLGLGRVIAMEHPELRCARVDLDANRPAGEVPSLLAELLADDAEDEVALRAGGRLVARIVRHAPIDRGPAPAVRADGSYLVTGGLGGLGLGVATWLVERGAGHVVLLGRRGPTRPEQHASLAALADRVTVVLADVADADGLARALATARTAAPLRGVVHAAGVADPAMLADLTPGRLREVMAAKARGALLLHAATRQDALDMFVMYASVAGLLGLAGTGNYAAANALLDALAHHRRGRGLPALSVDWGVFDGVGLASAADGRRAAAYTAGMRGMTPGEGLDALARLLADDRAQVAVVPFDAAQWVESYPAAAGSRRLAPLLATSTDAPRSGDAGLRARLAAADPGARPGLVLAVVRGHASQVLRIPEAALDVEAPLTELGMDSLMGLELRNRVEVALAVKVPPTLLWTYPTVAALSRHLAAELAGDVPADDAVPPTMTRSEAERLIDEEFEALT